MKPPLPRPGTFVYHPRYGQLRVMAATEGWLLVRRKNAVPFAVYANEVSREPILESPK